MKKLILEIGLVLLLSVALLVPTAEAASTKQPQSTNVHSYNICTSIKNIDNKVWKDVFYISTDGQYHIFLDVSAEPGSNMFAVHRNSLARWNVEINKVEFGSMMTGVFDKTGRTILKIKY